MIKRFQNRLFIGGLLFILVYGTLAVVMPFLEHHYQIRIDQRLLPMSSSHWFGTDQFGRDTFAMVIGGCFASLSVAAMAVIIGAGIGIPLGLIASTEESALSRTILSLNDLIFAFPALVIAILLHNIFGSGILTAGLSIGLFNIPVFARTIYGASRPLWTKDFVKAARLAGRSTLTIAAVHILPLVASVALAQIALQMGLGILAEAGLSYVGLGVVPPMPSWGRMLNDAQTLIVMAPRLAIIPGLAIALSAFFFTWIGDRLSDYADPRRREVHNHDRA